MPPETIFVFKSIYLCAFSTFPFSYPVKLKIIYKYIFSFYRFVQKKRKKKKKERKKKEIKGKEKKENMCRVLFTFQERLN